MLHVLMTPTLCVRMGNKRVGRQVCCVACNCALHRRRRPTPAYTTHLHQLGQRCGILDASFLVQVGCCCRVVLSCLQRPLQHHDVLQRTVHALAQVRWEAVGGIAHQHHRGATGRWSRAAFPHTLLLLLLARCIRCLIWRPAEVGGVLGCREGASTAGCKARHHLRPHTSRQPHTACQPQQVPLGGPVQSATQLSNPTASNNACPCSSWCLAGSWVAQPELQQRSTCMYWCCTCVTMLTCDALALLYLL